MASDSKRPPGSLLGRTLRIGKRVGGRAAKMIRESRVKPPPVPDGDVEVVFEQAGKGKASVSGVAPGGVSLLAAAAQLGVEINHYCGGQCSCGTCRIEILTGAENLSRQDGMEQMVLGSAHVAAGNRLACQARLLGPVRVRVPEWF